MVTLHEVARHAGVSPMTASRVFAGNTSVGEQSRLSVLASADELGYIPNEVARSLRSNRSHVIALIVSDIENVFFATIAKTAEKALAQAGYRLMISSSDEDGDQERDLLLGVGQVRADALLITPTPHNRKLLERMQRSGLPVVQLDRAVSGLAGPSVLLDNAGAARLAVDHLHARGHREVALISGPQSLTTGSERAEGALAAAAEYSDMTVTVVEAASFMHEPSVDTVVTALSTAPTAVIAGNNIVLEACMDAFSRNGIAVPEDIALIGFDDLPWMAWVRPSITAVRQPLEEMTRLAVEQLLACLSSPDGADTHVDQPRPINRLAAQLIERDSVPFRSASTTPTESTKP